MSWRGFFLRAGILSDGKNVALERGNLTVQNEIIPSGIVGDQLVTAGVETYTIAQLLTGFIRRDPTGAVRADLLPTAALIVAGIEGVFVGATFDFTISNEGSAGEVITVTTAAGLTLSGTMTIDGGDQRRFRAEVTGVTTPTVVVRSLGGMPEGVVASAVEIDRVADVSTRVITAVATLSVTRALHAERIILLGVNSGFTSSLPAATGSGDKYTFIVSVTITSNNYIINADGSDIMQGHAIGSDSEGEPGNVWETGAASDRITMDGTTCGGYVGDTVELIDIASGVWRVIVYAKQTGVEVTPFSTT